MTVVGSSLIDLFNHITFTATIPIDASYPKTQETPKTDLDLALSRKRDLEERE